MKKIHYYIIIFALFFMAMQDAESSSLHQNQRPVKEYTLILRQGKTNVEGIKSKGMTVNGSSPGPVLYFTEGDSAIIHVINKMKVESSVHWHGLLVPNYQDGVPYLTTPPIMPGDTLTYHFPIKQSGSYWYHSHTMLQEQKGVYGPIVIRPKKKPFDYDKDIVVVFSDYTNENPMNILRNLRRGNEWYQIKKKTAVPFSKVLLKGALKAQLKLWRDRMDGADIADIYYPKFLANGHSTLDFSNLQPGEKIRLRLINGAASTYFWLDFGQANPLLISADGVDVVPVHKKRLLFAIAEAYDFIITIPQHNALQIAATAQDGSGHALITLGKGPLLRAFIPSTPDKIEMMKAYAKMNMKMGAPAIASKNQQRNPLSMSKKYGMHMGNMDGMDMGQCDMHGNSVNMINCDMMHGKMRMGKGMKMNCKNEGQISGMNSEDMNMNDNKFGFMERQKYFNYDFLKAKENTAFPDSLPVRNILMNLTGNMNRYIWSINGAPVTETDNIIIKKGEVTRITLNNLTMMHHPMHLHGHYFRVINENGTKSPLKHTVDVPPMGKVIIEFEGDTTGDWLFHCHILYHMMSGMTRIFSYNTPRDYRMKKYNPAKVLDALDPYFNWGTINLGSNYSSIEFTAGNIRHEWNVDAEYGYKKDFEAEISYNYYFNDWLRGYVGINAENEKMHALKPMDIVGKAGIKYFTPYMFNLDLNVDTKLRPTIKIEKELYLLPHIFLSGEYEYTANFNLLSSKEPDKGTYDSETKWKVGLEYILSRDFSATMEYNNRYGWNAALQYRF